MTNTKTTTTPLSSSSTSSSPVLVSVHHADSSSEEDPDPLSSPPPPILADEPKVNDDEEKEKQPVNTDESTTPTAPKTTTAVSQMSPFSILEWYRTWFTLYDWRRGSHNNNLTPTTTTTTTTMMMMNVVRRQCHDALAFYVQFMASPSHQDKILKFLQYTFYMVSQALIWHQQRQRQQQQQQQFARPNISAQWLDKLHQEFTWARYVLRILQFPVALDAALHQSWTPTAAPDENDPTLPPHRRRQTIYNVLGRILTYSMVVYYPTEFMAYLLWMKPKALLDDDTTATMTTTTTTFVPSSSWTTTTLHHHPQQPQRHGSMVSLLYHVVTTWRDPPSSSCRRRSFPPPETWSYLSCRCWLIYIVTELIQSHVQYRELTTTTTTLVDPNKQQQQRQHILLQSLRNLLFLLPCTAWSMSKWDSQPIISSRAVNTLLWFESIVSLYQAIQHQRPPPVTTTTKPELPNADEEPRHQESSQETNI